MSDTELLPPPMFDLDDSPRAPRHGRIAEHKAADKSQKSLGVVRLHVSQMLKWKGALLGSSMNDYHRHESDEGFWAQVSYDSPRKRAGEMLAEGLLSNLNVYDESLPALYALTDAGRRYLRYLEGLGS